MPVACTKAATPIALVISSLAPSALAGPAASQPVSASSYGRPEDVGVAAVVIPPLKFSDVERQVFGADVVEGAHDAAFQERPEAVDGLGVDVAPDIFAPVVLTYQSVAPEPSYLAYIAPF